MADAEVKERVVSGRRRWVRPAALLLAALGLAATVGFLRRPSPPPIPGADLPGARPPVARAVAEARAAVRSAPDSADAWGRLGMVLMTHEYPAEARECFRQAEARDPTAVRWIYLRAFLLREGDAARAAELLRRAVSLDQQNVTCRLLLGDILLSLGRSDGAEEQYLQGANVPEAEARARLGLARVALSRDDLPRALEQARRAATVAPSLRGPAELLAQIYLRNGDRDAAQQEQARLAELTDASWPDPYLERVMRLNVGEAPRLELAQRLLGQGLEQDAIDIAEEILRDYPESISAWLSLCRAHLRRRAWVAAQAAAERALALAPDDAAAWVDLGTAVGMQGQWQRAADCYRHSLRLNPQDGDTHYQLAFSQLRLGDRAAAERSFRESVRLRPQFAPGWRELGRLLADNHEQEEAERYLRRAVNLAPKDTVARGLLDDLTRRAPAKQ